MARITLTELAALRGRGEKLVMLTCYDASFAALCDEAGVELLLVGDSLGMVVQGHETTLPVTMDDMAYHTACVARGSKRGLVIADLPFGSYQASKEQALVNAVRLMAAGGQMVKLEGWRPMLETVRFLVERGIPVCGHVGLTPQAVHQLGGFRVQGKTADAARVLLDDAKALQDAGAAMIVLEAIPSSLSAQTTAALVIPTIGIAAGAARSGQVLVLHAMLDLYPGEKAKFVRNFMAGANGVRAALRRCVEAVKSGEFPGPEHSLQ
jgi:3-methyl-2-oxobutanoate hydroxymethyltransferase